MELLKCEGERATDRRLGGNVSYRNLSVRCGRICSLGCVCKATGVRKRERERVGQQLVVVGGKWPENSVNENYFAGTGIHLAGVPCPGCSSLTNLQAIEFARKSQIRRICILESFCFYGH